MKKGIAIMLGGGEEPEAETEGGMDVQGEERRSALSAFFKAAQAGDVEGGLKAWARMGECGPPPLESGEDEAEDIGPEETKPAKRGIYRE